MNKAYNMDPRRLNRDQMRELLSSMRPDEVADLQTVMREHQQSTARPSETPSVAPMVITGLPELPELPELPDLSKDIEMKKKRVPRASKVDELLPKLEELSVKDVIRKQKEEDRTERTDDNSTGPMSKPRMLERWSLYPHQIAAVSWVVDRERAGVQSVRGGLAALEMGLGKTLIALSVVVSDWQEQTGATLYVCNKTLLRTVGLDARKFFGHTMQCLLLDRRIHGEDKFLTFNDQTPYKNHLIIVTYDTIAMLANHLGLNSKFKGQRKPVYAAMARAFFNHPWHRVIADESQRFVNPKTIIYRALNSLQPGKRMCLTGTPMRNYSSDVFAQLFFCGLYAPPVGGLPAINPNDVRTWTIQNYNKHQLASHVLSVSVEDAKIDLPPKRVIDAKIELTGATLQIYNLLLGESRTIMSNFQKRQAQFADVLVLFTRLRQVCNACHLLAPQCKQKPASKWDKNDMERDRPYGILGGRPALESAVVGRFVCARCKTTGNITRQGVESDAMRCVACGDATCVRCGHVGHAPGLCQDVVPGTIQLTDNYLLAENWIKQRAGESGHGSPKLRAIAEILTKHVPKDDRVLLFSTWSDSARLAYEVASGIFGEKHVLYVDGQTKDRDAVFAAFRESSQYKVLCMTMVGSMGLTLVEANHVILMEPHWNECNILQASARVWRIGQTKPVTIWKLVVSKSIEHKMDTISKDKTKVQEELMKEGVSLEKLLDILS